MKRLIRFDWAIKKILRDKANFGILEGFLSELLKDDIQIQELLESESNKESRNEKVNRVDLLVKNSAGELILIEVQNQKELDYLQRILFGSSRLITEHLEEGVKYDQIKKVYTVSIVFFSLGIGEDYVYHGTTEFTGLHKKDRLKLDEEQQEMYMAKTPADLYPEHYLIMVSRFKKDKGKKATLEEKVKDKLDEWIYFLKTEAIKDNFKAKGLKEAKEKLDILKMSEEDRREYQAYLDDLRYQASMFDSSYGSGKREGVKEGIVIGEERGEKRGIAIGKEEGIAIGEAQSKLAMAKGMKEEGVASEIISKLTGLSLEDVEKL